jgi:hypothetical protein
MLGQIMQSELLVELSVEQQQLLFGGTWSGVTWSLPKTLEGSCDDLKDFDVGATCRAQSSGKWVGIRQEVDITNTDVNGQKSCSKRITYQCGFSLF